ncbi:DUF3180 domain-containing protein [Nocardioides sp. TRM66260-LWL]|uniref:DUF3180 domain-containing protein n=1 Tax=Nocardioides sp. TRM66260-LWL TaxID=2874478 RepID=UPI001CC80CFD|nr:DUF3180 domain-containing protein [Nocardioides sp. TRM66260-LWL]MBZ5734852.1 DUF3180 domain-containing protein [Nocardioides sp. TRM66260-LWL]
MTSAPEPGPRSGDQDGGPRLGPASGTVLAVGAIVGLVAGWGFHRVHDLVSARPAPTISPAQPIALVVIAIGLGWTAFHTHRAVQVRRERLEAHRAVNRLALGRAAAYVGAVVAGWYVGYGVSWLGVDAELSGQRILRAAIAAALSIAIVVAGLLLERACRVRSDEDDA